MTVFYSCDKGLVLQTKGKAVWIITEINRNDPHCIFKETLFISGSLNNPLFS